MASKSGFFVGQMAQYSSYHRDFRNRATHLFGIPAIVYSLLVIMALAHWQVGAVDISLGMVFAAAVLLFYLKLDLGLGLGMIAVFVPILAVAEWTASLGTSTVWTVFGITFVGGWALQLIGHVFEGRRPALADNLLQALIGPMFILAEVVFATGLRKELKAEMEARWKTYAKDSAISAEDGAPATANR